MTRNLTLDAGALIALERGNERALALLRRVARSKITLAIPAAALAQAWRASPRQHRMHLLLGDEQVTVTPLDVVQALAIGALLARTGTTDVIDASVAVTARDRGDAVVTSDPDDISRLDPDLAIIAI